MLPKVVAVSVLFVFQLYFLHEAHTKVNPEGKCPDIQPICKCPLKELCKKDEECSNGQKCCMDCCGGHKCVAPVKGANCTREHEEIQDCGSSCPLTCKNPEPKLCVKMCVEGCFCENGFYRRTDGECVLKKDC